MFLVKTKKKERKFLHLNSRDFAKIGVSLFLVLFMYTPTPTHALTDEERLQALNQQIRAAQEKLSQIRSQEASLQGQLEAFDVQINAIQLKINATQYQINIINNQIRETNRQITAAELELQKQKSIMAEYLKTMYVEGQTSTLELIAESKSFSDFVDRSEYLNTMQENVQEAANRIVDLKNRLSEQKKQQEIKKAKAEILRAQQKGEQDALSAQRSGKQYLLDQTQGNESNYKSYLSGLQRQFSRLQDEIWAKAGGGYISLGHVQKGSIIGYIGNTGYSTGCHLHFEIRTSPSTHVNPANYLSNGYFIPPAAGVSMNVPYGYSAAYFPGVFHTGQDYADGCAGTPIRAAGEGEIIKRVSGRPNTYPWSVEYGNYVMIRHTNGMYSLYGHMR